MSRRTDLLQNLLQSEKFGDEKSQEQKFLAATAELILTDLINIAIKGVEAQGSWFVGYQSHERLHDIYVREFY